MNRLPANIFLPALSDRSLGKAIQDLYKILSERLNTEIQSGTYAHLPTSEGSDRFYYATDTGNLYYDSTIGWVLVGGTHTSAGAQGDRVNITRYREVISTTATPTDSSANLLPANALILDVSVRVLTGLTGTLTTFTVGDPTTAARFATAVSKALNTSAVGILQWSGAVTTLATGPSQPAAAKVRLAATSGTLTAGSVEVIVHAMEFTAPTS